MLFVALGSAWTSHAAGVSLAAGGFLAGVMLAETEYRHQVEAVIKPFRDCWLFFITVGMLLDLGLLWREFALIAATWVALTASKSAIMAAIVRAYGLPWFKSVRAAIVLSIGGEFGIALLTLLLQGATPAASAVVQPLFVAIVLSMVTSPFLLRNNRSLARRVLREHGPHQAAPPPDEDPTADVARREHVILCGFGRVGQNIARVLESQGFEYIAMDLDPARVRNARQGGDPVVYGDSSDDELLRQVGLVNASAVVITFASPATSIGIIRSVRAAAGGRADPVRTQDDTGLKELTEAGATEVVPETFEASLMLVSHTLMLLNVPVSRVVRTVGAIRNNRYSTLRNIFRRDDALPIDDAHAFREELKSVVVPPGAWAVGRSIGEVRQRGAEVASTRRPAAWNPRPRARGGHAAARGRRGRALWAARGARTRRGRAARRLRVRAGVEFSRRRFQRRPVRRRIGGLHATLQCVA